MHFHETLSSDRTRQISLRATLLVFAINLHDPPGIGRSTVQAVRDERSSFSLPLPLANYLAMLLMTSLPP